MTAPPWLVLLTFAAAGKLIHDLLEHDGGKDMHNCHNDVLAYHNEDVALPQKEIGEMRDRRNANRRRLKDGLKDDGQPSPIGCHSQGSYAMGTMIQDTNRDYDIDDGVYFTREKLQGPNGGDKSALDAREMVRNALDDGSFSRPPEKRKNCVRVFYSAGYHVDVPVYRRRTEDRGSGVETWYELASSNWRESDPLEVTEWFRTNNRLQSPDENNGRQLRRIVRLLKAFARSRTAWRGSVGTGFMITKLVTERYRSNVDREDRALYDTMVGIRDRLDDDLEIAHPTVSGETLTDGPDDARARNLRDKLDWAVDRLEVLFEPDCSREDALDAWDVVFNTDFFSQRLEPKESASSHFGAAAKNGEVGVGSVSAVFAEEARSTPAKPVDKRGGGRYA
jgi:hypothetical protein